MCCVEAIAPLMAVMGLSPKEILSFHVTAADIDGGNKVSMCCF